MKKLLLAVAVVFCFSVSVMSAVHGDDDAVTLRATLRGDNETPPTNSKATADFKATQNADGTFSFTLTFSGLSANLAASHLHFAPRHVNGGVMIFICGGDSQPVCPAATSGTITGTFGAANVVGPTGQGIAAGDFASALEAIQDGLAYINVHTATFPAGEARGQVRIRRGDGDRDDRRDRD